MKIQCTLDQPLVMDCDCPSSRGTENYHIHNLTPEKLVHYLHKKRNTEAKHKQTVCDDQFGKDYIYLVCQKNRNKKFVEKILSLSGSEQTGLLVYSSWFQPCLTLYITAHSSCCCWSLLYSAILCSRADSLHLHVILHEWIVFLYSVFEYPLKWCTYSAGMAGATWNCCCLGASSVYTVQPCTVSLHTKSH